MFSILIALLFSSTGHAADPYFIDYGIVTLTDQTPSATLTLNTMTRWFQDPKFNFSEIIFARMDVADVEKELTPPSKKQGQTPPSVCVPTVRALLPDGYVGINSLTYGGRLRTSGTKIIVKALKTCGKTLRYKVTAVSYWNAEQRKEDIPSFKCNQPKEGWCKE